MEQKVLLMERDELFKNFLLYSRTFLAHRKEVGGAYAIPYTLGVGVWTWFKI